MIYIIRMLPVRPTSQQQHDTTIADVLNVPGYQIHSLSLQHCVSLL